ncbi:hypothetical protein BDF14DRAFT_1880875 [Spinellus fusiger]|nr:hypothetical protein BDF14DRAFT_1880875 [Spinellus fusiger]
MQPRPLYEPKNARTLPQSSSQDDFDLFSTNPPRLNSHKVTGTQALVEFLNTTSPEEFQPTSQRTSTTHLFFRRRNKNKQVQVQPISQPSPPTASTPGPKHVSSSVSEKSSYIEIIPRVQSRESALSTMSGPKHRVRHSDTQVPLLPSKSPRSSLYTESLRHSSSIRSQMSNARARTHQENQNIKEKKRVDAVVVSLAGRDAVEQGLLQRLERYKLSQKEKPSDVVSSELALAHIKALHVSVEKPESEKTLNTRHVQVQTMTWEPSGESVESPKHTLPPLVVPTAREGLELQLAQEILQRKRAEAALEETIDNFEVLSGLAYKKLRELWEEKMRWENACIELRDRLLDTIHPARDTMVSLPSDYVESTLNS